MADNFWEQQIEIMNAEDNSVTPVCMHHNGPGCIECETVTELGATATRQQGKPRVASCTCRKDYRDPFCKACGRLPDPNPDAPCSCKGKRGWHALACPHHPYYGKPDSWAM